MGVIKKYKIIYERSIIISNLIFKANRERKKKVLYLLNSSSRKLFSKSHASHQSLGKEILNLLKKKKEKPTAKVAPSDFVSSVLACSVISNGCGSDWDYIKRAHPGSGSVFEAEASTQTNSAMALHVTTTAIGTGPAASHTYLAEFVVVPWLFFLVLSFFFFFFLRNCNLELEWRHSDLKWQFWPISDVDKKYYIPLRRQ